MAIRNDYLLDMIARFVQALIDAAARRRSGDNGQALAQYEEVVGQVLDMDSSTALALSPMSLVTMMSLSAVDERMAHYAAYALMRSAEVLDAQGSDLAGLRRSQADALAGAYDFDPDDLPPELAAAENGESV